ncbi:MAG: DUF1059 domain-containing protein [Herminiimonas sp.]|nr:DUF1059 domain-containing protein [Herminiimonas sp.]
MGRKYIDCRDFPGAVNCTVALSADTDHELLEAAVEHGVAVHHHKDSPEFRQQLLQLFKDEQSSGSKPTNPAT